MTEAQWLNCGDADSMLRFLGGRGPPRAGLLGWLRRERDVSQLTPQNEQKLRLRERKLRLLACACCCRIAGLLVDPRSLRALDIAELHAAGRASEADLIAAREEARAAYETVFARGSVPHLPSLYTTPGGPTRAWIHAARAVLDATQGAAAEAISAANAAAWSVGADYDNLEWARQAMSAAVQVALIRDIFGNPFREVLPDPAWLRWNDGTVPRIARGISDEGRFADLPILHDALLDAGCDNEDILAHCRTPEGHVRGCWVIDLLLETS
jgi:hypothetical protein